MGKVGRPSKVKRPPGRRGRMPGEKYRKKEINFSRSIFKVLAYGAPGMSVKKTTMAALNSMVIEMFKRIGREAGDLCQETKQKVLGARAIEGAVKMIFPGQLREYALNSGQDAIQQYREVTQKKDAGQGPEE